jgi:hypothetical protein
MTAKGKTQREAPAGVDSAPVRLNVKLASGVAPRRSEEVFSRTTGLRSAIQLFPEEKEEELQSFYIVEVDASAAERAVAQLNNDPDVEYVEAPPRRKLIW